MSAIPLIKDFTERRPNAEFGPAHIVLSDYNLADCFLLWAMANTWRAFQGSFGRGEGDTQELLETMNLLCQLADMPEAVREAELESGK